MSLLRKESLCHWCKRYLNEDADETDDNPHVIYALESCANCQTAEYCSDQCENKHKPHHKETCRRIKTLKNAIRHLEETGIHEFSSMNVEKLRKDAHCLGILAWRKKMFWYGDYYRSQISAFPD